MKCNILETKETYSDLDDSYNYKNKLKLRMRMYRIELEKENDRKYGVIVKAYAWLYEKPFGAQSDELLMGWAVNIIGEENGWCEVTTHYGYQGYLKKKDLKLCSLRDLRKRDLAGETAVVSMMFADILEKPAVHGEILATLSRGSYVEMLPENVNGYQKVLLSDGQTGYLSCVSLKQRKDSDAFFYDCEPETFFMRQKLLPDESEQTFRKRLLFDAKSYLGTQYRWAGKSAMGIDCSGLTFMCYMMNGILIYRDARIQKGYPVKEIPFDQAKPGDLLYFPGHIAMYLGNLRYIHATGNEMSHRCVINSLDKNDAAYRKDLADALLSAGGLLCM